MPVVLLGQADGVVIGLDGEVGLDGLRRHVGIEEHVADGVGIGMGVYDVGVGVGCYVSALTALAEAPTELIAAVLDHEAALAGLPVTTPVDIPRPHVLVRQACLVAYLQVAHFAAFHHPKSDVAFCALAVDAHLPGLCDSRVSLAVQHHADVETVERWTGIKGCCRCQCQQQGHLTS